MRLSSVPTTTLEAAWERVDWYGQTLCWSRTITNASQVGVTLSNDKGPRLMA